ncbi:MAG: hypothetical protein NC421_09250 [Lachnospiraceae bacterium]|nr:hypothetical protein [Lachnospiraceae bacterium]
MKYLDFSSKEEGKLADINQIITAIGVLCIIAIPIICARVGLNLFPTLIISFIVAVITILIIKERNTTFNDDLTYKNVLKLKKKYGYCSVKLGKYINHMILVFPQSKIIIIDGIELEFSEIIDFKINDMFTYKTTTNNTSAVGRAVVGGLLFGGIGALIGANTSSSTTEKETISYKFNIVLNNLSNPNIVRECYSDQDADKLFSILKIIIDSNQS